MNWSGSECRSSSTAIGGFAACPNADRTDIERLAQEAVAQAAVNAHGPPRAVALDVLPAVVGTWTTPVAIDPFTVSIEEKCDTIRYWMDYADRVGVDINNMSQLHFVRQERVMATSDGTCVRQTLYESDGTIRCDIRFQNNDAVTIPLLGLQPIGKGWELFVEDRHVLEQIDAVLARGAAWEALQKDARPSMIGRYTLVCDGATMASLLEQTLGIATQLDRALGYEANAGGTSFIDDPLGMVGHYALAAPSVTVTANRTAPTQLATVKWDDEGVAPEPFTLIKDGVLTDFQTTREQAGWLAPYYQRQGRPMRSNGCAAAEDALVITLQHMPNLALTPNASAVGLDDLVAGVKDGILLEGCIARADFQARNGLLGVDGDNPESRWRKITNGKVGPALKGGAVMFNTRDLWKHITAVGGATTQAVLANSQYPFGSWVGLLGAEGKGQPPQRTSHSVSAVAATISNQAVIDLSRKI